MRDCPEPKKNKKGQNKNVKDTKIKRDESDYGFIAEAFMTNFVEGSWFGDNAANCHMTNDRSCFETFEEVVDHPGVCTASQEVVPVKGKGTVRIKSFANSGLVIYMRHCMCLIFARICFH